MAHLKLLLGVGEAPCIEATYEGDIGIEARLAAKDQMAKAAEDAGFDRVLIDLTRAKVQPYAIKDALRVTNKVASLPALRRLAYLMPSYRSDMVATVLAASHGSDFVSIFNDRISALDWLATS